MPVNRIKCLFYCWLLRKNENTFPNDYSFLIYSNFSWPYKINLTWHLLDVITSDLNPIVWSWQHPCVRHYGVKTSVSAPWWFLYHTHYIVSGIFCLFIIVDYDIFSSLRPTISYPRTMSAYNFFLFVSSPYVPTLDLITYLFDPTLTTFPIFLLFNLLQTLICS